MKSTARVAIALIAFLVGSLSTSVVARQQNSSENQPVARSSDIYCTGFISDIAPRAELQIIGAEFRKLDAAIHGKLSLEEFILSSTGRSSESPKLVATSQLH